MPTTVLQIKTDRKTSKAASEAQKEKAKEAGETVQAVAQAAQPMDETKKGEEQPEPKKLDVTTKTEKGPTHEAVAKEAEKGYDLMIIGLGKTVARKSEFHDGVTEVAAGFEGPLAVADARGLHLEEPIEGRLNILVPINGTATSRHAAEVAIVLARASKAPLTALYVTAGGKKTRSRHYEEAILKDIV